MALSLTDQLKKAKQDYEAAKIRGDQKAMDTAHALGQNLRAQGADEATANAGVYGAAEGARRTQQYGSYTTPKTNTSVLTGGGASAPSATTYMPNLTAEQVRKMGAQGLNDYRKKFGLGPLDLSIYNSVAQSGLMDERRVSLQNNQVHIDGQPVDHNAILTPGWTPSQPPGAQSSNLGPLPAAAPTAYPSGYGSGGGYGGGAGNADLARIIGRINELAGQSPTTAAQAEASPEYQAILSAQNRIAQDANLRERAALAAAGVLGAGSTPAVQRLSAVESDRAAALQEAKPQIIQLLDARRRQQAQDELAALGQQAGIIQGAQNAANAQANADRAFQLDEAGVTGYYYGSPTEAARARRIQEAINQARAASSSGSGGGGTGGYANESTQATAYIANYAKSALKEHLKPEQKRTELLTWADEQLMAGQMSLTAYRAALSEIDRRWPLPKENSSSTTTGDLGSGY